MIFDYLNWFNKNYFLTPGEFVILHYLLCLLKPLKELTVEFSAFKYSNCSILFLTICCLINQYEFDLTTHEVLAAKYTILASRFNYILAGDQRNLFMVITFLDYRFKNFDFVTDVQVRNEFKKSLKRFYMIIIDLKFLQNLKCSVAHNVQ